MARDNLDFELPGATAETAALYDRAVGELQRFVGDPVGTIDAAIEATPGFVMAHVFNGYLFGLAT